MEKNYLYGIEHFQSNGASPIFLLLELVLHFQDQSFVILSVLRISPKWWKIEQTLLPWNRKSSICHLMAHWEYCILWPCHLDLHFQLLLLSNRKLCLCHRIASLGILYIVTLTYIFKVKKFEMLIVWKQRKLAKSAQLITFIDVDIFHQMAWLHVVLCDLDLNFQGKNLKCQYLENGEN